MKILSSQYLGFWLAVAGLVPYFLRWQRLKGHKATLEVRALFWSLQVCHHSTKCWKWQVRLPLIQHLGKLVWEGVKEVLKDKLLKN